MRSMLLSAIKTDSAGRRFVLFGAIGLSGFLPNLLTLAVLIDALQLHYVLATVIATQVAIAWNFLLLENLVYRHRRTGPTRRRVAQFVALNNADLLLRIPLLAVLVEYAHIGHLIATVMTLVLVFVVRFLVTDRLVYRVRRRLTGGPTEIEFAPVVSVAVDSGARVGGDA